MEPWRFTMVDGSAFDFVAAGRIRSDDLDAIADAATAGAGIVCLPTWLLDGPLRPSLTAYRARGNDVYAVRPRARHVTSNTRVAIKELAVYMPDRLRWDAATGII